MAQSKASSTKKNNSQTAKKTDTKAKKNNRAADNQPPPPPPGRPIRREVTAVVLLFMTVFIVISEFNTDGVVIAFISSFLKGLIGWGYWLAAPALLFASILLFFHKGKPVVMRVTSVLLLPLICAALYQLIACDSLMEGFELKAAVGLLFEQGQALRAGGVIGGLMAVGLEMAFSVYGAAPILIAAFAFFLILAVRGSFSGLFSGKKEHTRKKYDPAMYETEPDFPELMPVIEESKPAKAPKRARTEAKIERVQRGAYPVDVPLGDDEEELGLSGPGHAVEEPYVPEEKPGKRAKVRKKNAQPETAAVEPMPVLDEEEPFAADSVVDGFREIPLNGRGAARPVAVSAEISDPPKSKKISRSEVEAEAQAVADAVSSAPDGQEYQFPPISLLRSGSAGAVDAREEILINRERLEGAIRSFGISAAIVGVIRGPTVTRYDIELDQGVKLARVTNLAGDLALALGVINVRIAPIPDKISTVGIEVPNKIVSTVYLRDIIESPKFSGAKSKLSFAIGKDIGGDCIVGNIAKLPHMLIAGTTGSGKSVCMNSLILSLLYKARPDEVRLIMIDPKMVELGIYNGIPHLYVPVVTDPKKAAGALQWSVVEMLKRYRLFSEVGVRDLASYNSHCAAAGEATLPSVVIVIDELADLMLVASKEVEESICRVAQMGRAAGMHLVIATQRPSADVITGLMKANIPSRIAFAVSSTLESRIILDQAGAEKLVGMGDMLFSPVGCGKPTRVQGAFVSDEERENVIQFIKESAGEVSRNNEIEEYMNKAAEDKGSGDGGKSSKDEDTVGGYDEMLPQAVEVVLETGSCSVSMLQRRVKLGYSRAARIVDQMEELGIVGPYEGAKPRQVVVDRSGWHDIQVRLGLIADDDLSLAAEMSEDSDDYDFDTRA